MSIEQKEFVLSRQLLKSGTSIGANIREAQYAESRADFVHKIRIALKEANETEYWLDLLSESKFIDPETYIRQQNNIKLLLKILIRIVNSTLKSNPLSVNR
ncbi:four helix bundle protein [Flavobacterium silvaticum]|uniref:four helix bundle protein n=1 Tax=Flavobacterium silvaticum TaxID=1852020 RepID=UPI00293BE2F3|nr:four helix bundle protein [Flavobacterium silvaticum]